MMPDHETRRHIVTYALSDMVCSMWAAQFWLRHEGRVYDALFNACLAVRNGDTLGGKLFELLSQSGADGEADRTG